MRKLIIFFAFISILLPVFSYSQTVQEAWVARYNGPYNHEDVANAIAVDDYGNVYVTGESKGSGSNYDYATIKYNSLGVQQWVARYNGTGNADDRAVAIAVDANGNVYVTGESKGSGSGYDYATIKYNSAGVQQWVARYNGTNNSDDRAHGIALDGNGNVYVTGESKGNGSSLDYATIKYNSSGSQVWVKRYDGPVHYNDVAYAIAVDINGNVYVTGESKGSGTCLDYATIKYDTNGNQKWVKRCNNPANSDDSAYAIALDGSGNVYVTGKSKTNTGHYDYATIKYDNNGTQLWVSLYNGTGNEDDIAHAIAVDNSGNVYVTGESRGQGTNNDYATIKYDTNGNLLWVARYNSPGNDEDIAHAIVVDSSGNVYVTGESEANETDEEDYATIKYDTNGNLVWIVRYNGPETDYDSAYAIALGSSGNVCVTGESKGHGTEQDYATICYAELSANFSASPTTGNQPLTVTFTDTSSGIITGWSWNFGDGGTSTDKNPSHTYTSTGTFTVTLTVTGPGGSDTLQKVDCIHISEVPDIRTPIVDINFGNVIVGSSIERTTTIYNDGNETLTINNVTRSSGSTDFTYVGPSTPFNIPAYGSQTVTVRFSPTSAGAKTAAFNVNSNDPDEANVSFNVSGTGTAAGSSVSPSSYNFGAVIVGSSSGAQTFTVSNTGTANLVIGTITLTGTDPTQFGKQNDNCSGQTVAPSGSCTVQAVFSPTSAGGLSASLSIPSNAPTVNVPLSGTGTVPGSSVYPTSYNFGNILVGSSSGAQTFTVSNTGTANLVIGTITLTGTNPTQFGKQNDNCSGQTVAPSGSCTVQAVFSPTSTGGLNASLSIPSNAPGSPTLVPLSGTGTAAGSSVSPSSYNFGAIVVGSSSGAQTFTVSNTGTANLVIGTITLTGTDPSTVWQTE